MCAHEPAAEIRLDESGRSPILVIAVSCSLCGLVYEFPDRSGKPTTPLRVEMRERVVSPHDTVMDPMGVPGYGAYDVPPRVSAEEAARLSATKR